MARKEAETAPEAFKTKRDASDSLDLRDARASCSFAPALLLKARLTGRFDATSRRGGWNFAAKEAIEALENAARGDGAFSRLASENVDETRDILLRDWEAARASAASTGERLRRSDTSPPLCTNSRQRAARNSRVRVGERRGVARVVRFRVVRALRERGVERETVGHPGG